MIRSALLAAGFLAVFTIPATACEIAGTWNGPVTFQGRMADRGTRTLTIVVRPDCRYQFSVPGVVETAGVASAGWSAGSFGYRNEAGSIGTLTVSGQGANQTLDVVQTQGNYTAKLRRRGR
jgi:hypothetical protein